eukprot:15045634-Alexandrium_andersonii.AAC.1
MRMMACAACSASGCRSISQLLRTLRRGNLAAAAAGGKPSWRKEGRGGPSSSVAPSCWRLRCSRSLGTSCASLSFWQKTL